MKLRKDQNCANPVMVEYLKTVFSEVGEFDPAAVEEVPRRRVQPYLNMAPTVHEISRAVMVTGNG